MTLLIFLYISGYALGQELYTFERCKGGLTCVGKQACFIVERNKESLTETFFPLRNCGAEGKGKEVECACLHVEVASGKCNEESNCDTNKKCKNNLRDCDAPNICVHSLGSDELDSQLCNKVKKADEEALCYCATPDTIILRSCESDINCERNEETCQTVKGLEGKRCVGKDPSPLLRSFLPELPPPTPPSEDASPEPCIAIDALEHVHADNLVFSQHLRSSVLCDRNGSCASAGHIVQFHERFMTMGTYCRSYAKNGCLKTVRLVNSPRMSRGIRISSRTDHLQFTALSARYKSRIEERLLTFALQFGL